MPFILLGRGEPRRVQTGVVSANYFDVLGVRPLLGRTFRAGEDQAGAEPVLVLSYGFWQNRLGGDPGIVGRTFEMNDRIHTVVGVLPPVPQYPAENDVYMPASSCPFRSSPFTLSSRTARMLHLFGRLAPGVTLDRAQTELEGIAGTAARPSTPRPIPRAQGFTIRAASLHDELTGKARPTLLLLIGTTGFVLLIACANIANLTLARLIRRSREMALRAALGADRGATLPPDAGRRRAARASRAACSASRSPPGPCGSSPLRGALHASRRRDRAGRRGARVHPRASAC